MKIVIKEQSWCVRVPSASRLKSQLKSILNSLGLKFKVLFSVLAHRNILLNYLYFYTSITRSYYNITAASCFSNEIQFSDHLLLIRCSVTLQNKNLKTFKIAGMLLIWFEVSLKWAKTIFYAFSLTHHEATCKLPGLGYVFWAINKPTRFGLMLV